MRAAALLFVVVTALVGSTVPVGAAPEVGPPTATPIRHVVTVMQEGHTFDNYFGSFPGANGAPAGTCMPVDPATTTPCVEPFALGASRLREMDHGADAFATAYAGGAMNGFVAAQGRSGVTRTQPMGTYGRTGVPTYWDIAKRYVLFDRFFASSPRGSVPNHLAWVTGSVPADAPDTTPSTGWGDLQTVFDRLEAKGVSWRFYVQNYDSSVTFRRAPGTARGAQVTRVPLLGLARYVDDPKLFSHIKPISEYYRDLADGTLPAVSYVVPSGPSERAPTRVASGERFVSSVLGALIKSSAWSSSAFALTYDGWGGYYDHVVPETRPDGTTSGFRVPTLLVSAFARRGVVDHASLDTTSIVGFIDRNWHLVPSTAIAAGGGIEGAFDFTRAPRAAAILPVGTPAAAQPQARIGVVFLLYGLAVVAALTILIAVARRARRQTEVVLP